MTKKPKSKSLQMTVNLQVCLGATTLFGIHDKILDKEPVKTEILKDISQHTFSEYSCQTAVWRQIGGPPLVGCPQLLIDRIQTPYISRSPSAYLRTRLTERKKKISFPRVCACLAGCGIRHPNHATCCEHHCPTLRTVTMSEALLGDT
jgi:hypothetical protein